MMGTSKAAASKKRRAALRNGGTAPTSTWIAIQVLPQISTSRHMAST
jgi:hypothetical protein